MFFLLILNDLNFVLTLTGMCCNTCRFLIYIKDLSHRHKRFKGLTILITFTKNISYRRWCRLLFNSNHIGIIIFDIIEISNLSQRPQHTFYSVTLSEFSAKVVIFEFIIFHYDRYIIIEL